MLHIPLNWRYRNINTGTEGQQEFSKRFNLKWQKYCHKQRHLPGFGHVRQHNNNVLSYICIHLKEAIIYKSEKVSFLSSPPYSSMATIPSFSNYLVVFTSPKKQLVHLSVGDLLSKSIPKLKLCLSKFGLYFEGMQC